MKAIIVGAQGYIGGHLKDRLIESGWSVVAIDKVTARSGKADTDVSICSTDVISREFHNQVLTHLLRGGDSPGKGNQTREIHCGQELVQDRDFSGQIDAVFHLVGPSAVGPSFESPTEYVESHVLGTAHVAELARVLGSQLIYASTFAVKHSRESSPYTWCKWAGEELCRLYHRLYRVPTTVARVHTVFGGDSELSHSVLAIWERELRRGNKITVSGDGQQHRDFIHVDDVCSALEAIAHSSASAFREFEVGTGESTALIDLARLLAPEESIEFTTERPGDVKFAKADITALQRDTGWGTQDKGETIRFSDERQGFNIQLIAKGRGHALAASGNFRTVVEKPDRSRLDAPRAEVIDRAGHD